MIIYFDICQVNVNSNDGRFQGPEISSNLKMAFLENLVFKIYHLCCSQRRFTNWWILFLHSIHSQLWLVAKRKVKWRNPNIKANENIFKSWDHNYSIFSKKTLPRIITAIEKEWYWRIFLEGMWNEKKSFFW